MDFPFSIGLAIGFVAVQLGRWLGRRASDYIAARRVRRFARNAHKPETF